MSAPTTYLLDANVFIAAERQYYSFPVFPVFWSELQKQHEAGRIFTTLRVRDEIKRGKGELTDWLQAMPPSFFVNDSTSEVAGSFSQLMRWVQSCDYKSTAKATFAQVADGWLIASCQHYGHRLVTHEASNKEAKAKVPIPQVCDQFGVPYCNTYEMLRHLGCCFR